jgi:hypothetical protein
LSEHSDQPTTHGGANGEAQAPTAVVGTAPAPRFLVDPDARAVALRALVDDAWVGHDEEMTEDDLGRIVEVVLAAAAGIASAPSPAAPAVRSGYLDSFVAGLRDWDLIDATVARDWSAHASFPAGDAASEEFRRETAHQHLVEQVLAPWVRLSGNTAALDALEGADLTDVYSVRRAIGTAAAEFWDENGAKQLEVYVAAAGKVGATVLGRGGDMGAAGVIQHGAEAGILSQLSQYRAVLGIEDASRLAEKVAGAVFGLPAADDVRFDESDADTEGNDVALLDAVCGLVSDSGQAMVLDAVSGTDWDALVNKVAEDGLSAPSDRQDDAACAALWEFMEQNPPVLPEAAKALAERQLATSAGVPALAEQLLGTPVKDTHRG